MRFRQVLIASRKNNNLTNQSERFAIKLLNNKYSNAHTIWM